MSDVAYLYREICVEGKEVIEKDFCPSDFGLKDLHENCYAPPQGTCMKCWREATTKED